MFLLEVNNLCSTLRPGSITSFRRKRRPLLKGVSLRIEEGTSLALLGESGSGKTTLARCIVGLQKPDSGTITYNGINLFPHAENRKAIGAAIQMLFQASGASLDPCMTVLDSLAEGLTLRDGRRRLRRFEPRAEVGGQNGDGRKSGMGTRSPLRGARHKGWLEGSDKR